MFLKLLFVCPLFSLLVLGERFEIPLRREATQLDGRFDDLKVKYVAPISVGTPSQNIEVVFDTSISLAWIPMKGCQASPDSTGVCANNRNVFDPEKSSSFFKTKGRFLATFKGSTTSGYAMKEEVKLLSKSGKKLTFPCSTTIGAAMEFENGEHAVFGLPSPHYTPVDYLGYDDILYQYPSEMAFNLKFFTWYTAGCTSNGCQEGGQLTFGDFDDKNCQSDITFVPIRNGTKLWDFWSKSIYVGGHRFDDKFLISTHSGEAYISIPLNFVEEYYKKWNATTIEEKYDTHAVACDTDLGIALEVGGEVFKISNENLLMPLSPQFQQKYGRNLCEVALKTQTTGTVIHLGEPFFRSYCVVHDRGNKQLGFAGVAGKNKNGNIDDLKEPEDCD